LQATKGAGCAPSIGHRQWVLWYKLELDRKHGRFLRRRAVHSNSPSNRTQTIQTHDTSTSTSAFALSFYLVVRWNRKERGEAGDAAESGGGDGARAHAALPPLSPNRRSRPARRAAAARTDGLGRDDSDQVA